MRFLSTPSARRTTWKVFYIVWVYTISIHALREEGDCPVLTSLMMRPRFLSTPSARRATSAGLSIVGNLIDDFYPRPPRGGRQPLCGVVIIQWKFLSTPSARRATTAGRCCGRCYAISIHALREEDDLESLLYRLGLHYFYPRPPRGGRLPRPHLSYDEAEISIHALREEGDKRRPVHCGQPDRRFLSTPSARRATTGQLIHGRRCAISIHALREEGDSGCWKAGPWLSISIHALREEGDV